MTARETLGVFVAGGLGATLRVVLVPIFDTWLAAWIPMIGTLLVNLLGCFAIGLLSELLSGSAKPIVLGGLLGGFTTYSAFALLSASLIGNERQLAALAQVALHVFGGLLCVSLGLWLGRIMASAG